MDGIMYYCCLLRGELYLHGVYQHQLWLQGLVLLNGGKETMVELKWVQCGWKNIHFNEIMRLDEIIDISEIENTNDLCCT